MDFDDIYSMIGTKSMLEQVEKERKAKKERNYNEDSSDEEEGMIDGEEDEIGEKIEEFKQKNKKTTPKKVNEKGIKKPIIPKFKLYDSEKEKQELIDSFKTMCQEGEDEKEEVPFYNPISDDKDQSWVKRTHLNKKGRSDCTISCSFCFTILSYYTQQHIKYKNQYRAVHVVNCKPKYDTVLKDKKDTNYEEMIPVLCSTCNVEVALLDQESVYHFFNVLPSSF